MYEHYWELSEKPFKNNMDPRFFYYSPEHEEALVRMLFCVTDSKGLMFLTGESGVGKTYLVRLFAAEMRDKGFHVANVVNPNLEPMLLLREILYSFGLREQHNNKVDLRYRLEDHLHDIYESGSQAILIVDEAQLIRDTESMEELRLLLNLEVNEQSLLNILCVGQPELWSRVRHMPQLLQRIGVAYQMKPFSSEETESYIRHRLNIAGGSAELFSKEACLEVFSYTRGLAREINTVCDMSMLIASGQEKQSISRNTIQECIREMRGGGAEEKKALNEIMAR